MKVSTSLKSALLIHANEQGGGRALIGDTYENMDYLLLTVTSNEKHVDYWRETMKRGRDGPARMVFME